MEGLTAADPQAIGEFRLRARLGAGGMGQVFLATSPGGRMVAVKIIHPELARDSDFVRRFRAEVEAARRVSGMYTAPVVAAGVDDRPPWLATAFVPGPSLADIVSRYGPLPVPALWRLAAGLADALRAIHATGLVHRDLKPANVLLASDGPRVIDFGISRAITDSRLTATGAIIGTPSFMSPEQVEGDVAGPPSDVFSLGSVLAFAACGVPPFSAGPGGSSASVLYRVVHGSPELGMVPAEARELIQACLAKEAAWRPDLGQVAARCAAAAEYLGLSPVAFWPPEVARVIEAQQAALAAEVEALPVPSSVGMPAFQGASAAGQAVPAGWPRTGPSRLGSSGPTGAWAPAGASGQTRPSALPGPSDARVSVSRRNLLIGAGAGSIAVAGGVAAWVIGSRSPASILPANGHESTMAGAPAGADGRTGAGRTGAGGSGPASMAWQFTAGNEVLANPGVANGVVYTGCRDNYLYAVNAATGKQIWKIQMQWVTAAPELVGGMVCVAAETGQFSAIHQATGAVAWQQPTGVEAPFRRTWAVDGGTVILPSETQPLQAYDAATGKVSGQFGSQGQYSGGVITASNGILYALDELGGLHAVRISDQGELWNASVNGAGTADTGLVVSDDTLYVATDAGTLYSLNIANGNQNWSYPTGGTLLSPPVVADGLVYVVDDGGNLHAVTAANGKQAWSHSAVASGEVGPVVSGGTLYVSTGLALQALDAKTGDALWSYTPSGGATGELYSTPAIANGLLYIGSSNENLYAIHI